MYKIFESRQPFRYNVKSFDELLQSEEMPNSFCMYQEQEMAALNYAGIDMADCYTAIKNIAKKRKEKVLAYKEIFIGGFKRAIVRDEHKSEAEAEDIADRLWQIIEDSARYSFNACLPGDVCIMSDDPSILPKRVDELYADFIPDFVGRSMGEDGILRPNRVRSVTYAGHRPVFRISLDGGSSIRCTKNHKFPTPRGIKTAEELAVGDCLYYEPVPYCGRCRLSSIKEITPCGIEPVYDVAMEDDPHNFVTCTGIVTSNSHAYCVALDSLYGAWLKAHHPLEFYETYLTMQNEKGDKDKMADAKDEAERYFSIKFPPFRFGQDNRSIHAVPEERSITNPLSAIKGFGSAVGEILYECGQERHKNFVSVLRWLDERGIKSSKTIPLIKIDYFDQFGSCRKLLTIAELFDYLKQGNSKQLARDKVPELIAPILEKHATYKNAKGAELKSYIITDMDGLLDDLESYVLGSDMPELDFRVKAQNQLDVLGYVDLTTGRKDDLRKLFIMDIYPLKSKQDGSIWTYKLKTKSLGSGKVASLDVRPREFSSRPLRKGDIIYAADVAKDKKGYWRLTQYSVLV